MSIRQRFQSALTLVPYRPAFAGIGLVMLAACATQPGGTYSPDVGDVVGPRAEFSGPPIRETASGSYLAGHLAQGAGDWSSAALFMNNALAGDPDNYRLLQRAFLLNLGGGEVEEALKQAEKLAEQEQALDLALVLLMVEAVKQGELEAAKEINDRITDEGLQTVLKPGVRAWLAAGDGDVEAATAALEELRAFGGFEALIALHRAFIFDYLGRVDEAEAEYQNALSLSTTLRAGQAYGSLLGREGNVDEAIRLYDTFRARDGSRLLAAGIRRLEAGGPPARGFETVSDGMAAILFDFSSVLQGELGTELTLVLLQIALHAQPDFPLAQLLLADILTRREQYPAADKAYLTIPADSDIGLAAAIRRANMLDDSEQDADALTLLRRKVRTYPSEFALHGRIGDLLRRDEQFVAAISSYNKAINLLPEVQADNWILFYTRGISYERSDQWPLAEADFKRALELRPNQPFVLNYLGYSWADQGVNLRQAEQMIRTAVQLRPQDGFIVDSLGWVLYRLGRFDEAVGILEEAVALSPGDQTINDHLGDALWRVGRELEARFQWQRAIDLNDDAEITETARDKLKNGLPPPPPPLDDGSERTTVDNGQDAAAAGS
ncbi:MAG: tetratricopeptide repeat protein [Alphaproteobacteria bacterium]|nr:tetratricopeptide repeat protein [Alphaproteobacteria bacterium SS10]